MTNTEENFQHPSKFSKKVFVFYVLTYITPVIITPLFMLFVNYLDFSGFKHVLFHPLNIIYFAVILLSGILLYKNFREGICSYDGSEESEKASNRIFTRMLVVTILVPVVSAILLPFVYYFIMRTTFNAMVTFSLSIATLNLFSLCFYVCFLTELEKALSFLPLKEEYLSLKLTGRFGFVSSAAVLGAILATASVFIVHSKDGSITALLLLQKGLPVGLISVCIAIFDILVMVHGVINRLNVLNKFTAFLSEGDYTSDRVPVERRDEIGILTNSINRFYASTRELLSRLDNSIDISNNSAEVLSSGMNESASSITQISANIESVKNRIVNQSAGVEETQATVNSIVNKLDSLNQSVEEQSQHVSDSSAAVEEMVANVNSVTEILKKNEAAVNSLSEASDLGQGKVQSSVETSENILKESEGLLEATSIIQNIAHQTNLLAMNAAIEAAHAGDAGKGFAVVADEIRKLAEQSNKQGKQISGKLKSLAEAISTVTDSTREVQNQFSIIFNLANTVKQQEEVIMQAMQEQTEGNQHVLDSIKGIDEKMAVVKDGSNEILQGGQQILTEMGTLANVTLEISSAMNEMSAGATQISTAINDVNTATNDNKINIDNLKRLFDSFKLVAE